MRMSERVFTGRARGQSMVEFVVIVPTLLLLVLGIIQFAQIYIAKSTLDLAAFEGVRAGTLHSASSTSIKCGIAHGLMPLYGASASPNAVKVAWLGTKCGVVPPLAVAASTDAQRYIAAYSNAFAAVDPAPLIGGKAVVDVQILNPTSNEFAAFGEQNASGKTQIPNSRLMWRPSTVPSGAIENIQEANLLVINVQYCYPMDVWFIKQIVQGLAIGANKLINNQTTFGTQCYTSGGVPLMAQSTMLMQSPAIQG